MLITGLSLIKSWITITGNGLTKGDHHLRLANSRQSYNPKWLVDNHGSKVIEVRLPPNILKPHERFQVAAASVTENPKADVSKPSDGLKHALPTNLSFLKACVDWRAWNESFSRWTAVQEHGSSIKQSTVCWTGSRSTWARRQNDARRKREELFCSEFWGITSGITFLLSFSLLTFCPVMQECT